MLVQKVLKLDIAFLSYGNLIEDIITDWWKVYFEEKVLKIWECVQSIATQKSIFTGIHCFYIKFFQLLEEDVLKI